MIRAKIPAHVYLSNFASSFKYFLYFSFIKHSFFRKHFYKLSTYFYFPKFCMFNLILSILILSKIDIFFNSLNNDKKHRNFSMFYATLSFIFFSNTFCLLIFFCSSKEFFALFTSSSFK